MAMRAIVVRTVALVATQRAPFWPTSSQAPDRGDPRFRRPCYDRAFLRFGRRSILPTSNACVRPDSDLLAGRRGKRPERTHDHQHAEDNVVPGGTAFSAIERQNERR